MKLRIDKKVLYFENDKIGDIEENSFDNETKLILEFHSSDIYSIIKKLKGKELLQDIKFYGLPEHIMYEIYLFNNIPILKICKLIDLVEWDYIINPKELVEHLELNNIIDEIHFSEGKMFIEMKTAFDKEETIEETVDYLLSELELDINRIIELNNISTEINFSAEHFIAGTSILQYFGKLLQEKYPEENIIVSIKQEGLKVSMIIETPDGKKEEIEEYLNRFGMVVTKQIMPEDFTSDKIQLLELKQELRDAQNKVESQREILVLKNEIISDNKSRIETLEQQMSCLLDTNNKNIQILLESLKIKDKMIKKLIKAVDSKSIDETKELLLELKDKDIKGYVSLKEHVDNAIVGSIVNAPSWVEFMITYFPK